MEKATTNRLIVPALGPFYASLGRFANPFQRIVFALLVMPSGWQKFTDPVVQANAAASISQLGFPPPSFWFWFVAALELFGGLALALGLLTRVVALLFFVAMLVAAFAMLEEAGAYQYPLIMAALAFIFFLRGGRDYSLDRLIGREF